MSDHETAIVRKRVWLRGGAVITNDAGEVILDQNGVVGGGGASIGGYGIAFNTTVCDSAGTALTFPRFANTDYLFVCNGMKDGGIVVTPYGNAADGTKAVDHIMVYPAVDGTAVTWVVIGVLA